MKKNKISKNWIREQNRDHYVQKSRSFGYRSRSAFKLLELNQKFNFIKKKTKLIDLGSSPGGWSQVASEIITSGKILSIDIKDMEKINRVDFLKGDFLDDNLKRLIIQKFDDKADVIISDMAANTTGNKSLDCIRTNTICTEVIQFSTQILKNNGIIVSKIFMGEEFNEVKNIANRNFKKIAFFKPNASKDSSKETYLHCEGLKTL